MHLATVALLGAVLQLIINQPASALTCGLGYTTANGTTMRTCQTDNTGSCVRVTTVRRTAAKDETVTMYYMCLRRRCRSKYDETTDLSYFMEDRSTVMTTVSAQREICCCQRDYCNQLEKECNKPNGQLPTMYVMIAAPLLMVAAITTITVIVRQDERKPYVRRTGTRMLLI